MGFYNQHVMPSHINCLCGMSEITDQRRKLVPQAEGLVVEVGIGSGHNLLFFVRFLMVEQLYSARSVLRAILRPWTTVDMNSNPKHVSAEARPTGRRTKCAPAERSRRLLA